MVDPAAQCKILRDEGERLLDDRFQLWGIWEPGDTILYRGGGLVATVGLDVSICEPMGVPEGEDRIEESSWALIKSLYR